MGRFVLFLLCFALSNLGKLEAEHLDKKLETPIFISLGSHCEVVHHMTGNNLRSAAFPLDWLLTLDFAGLLSLLQEDFALFMDENHLIQDSEGTVFNTYYRIVFLHELHDWTDRDFAKHYPEIREKYRRRINRFKECNYNKGKAYFIRAAYDLDINPNTPTLTKESSKVDRFQAEALKDVLRQKFPNLDFYLVIINYAEEQADDIIGIDRVLEFKVQKTCKKEDYASIFQRLIEHSRRS